jgi:predicted HicB family RNase H-like nuclease
LIRLPKPHPSKILKRYQLDLVEKELRKSYSGGFNVRINPELHKKAILKSKMLGISLNQLVQKAIEEEVRDIT